MKELKQLLIESQAKDIYDIVYDLVDYFEHIGDDKKAIENFVSAYTDSWDVQDRKDMLGLLLKEVNKAYKNECLPND